MDTNQVEGVFRAACEVVRDLGWTIGTSKDKTADCKNRVCCPFGACRIWAESGIDLPDLNLVLRIDLTWVAEFALGFDGIVPAWLNYPSAYFLGRKLAKEYT
jgi:hypothetical protein